MSRIVIVAYRPKKGKDAELLKLIQSHMAVLKSQNLVTDRKPIVMRAADKTIIEIFEWKSAEAINEAHSNPIVLKLWEQFCEVCKHDIPVNCKELHNLFSEFEPIN